MSIESGFDALQGEADATPEAVAEARRRRDVFRTSLPKEPDVDTVVPSGSLARGTHKDPIHDVDLVCVFHADEHPDWLKPGASALDALTYTRTLVNGRLGSKGSDGNEVRRVDLKNHSVKCFLDDPGAPDAFTVDVVPAIVHPDGGFWIPEQFSKNWVRSDPMHMIAEADRRHSDWNQFKKLVRVLKRWNTDHGKHMKSLVIEVLALDLLVETASRCQSLAKFFTAASDAVYYPIQDPAGLCGDIQPDLDQDKASAAFADAAKLANQAIAAEARNETREAQCLWNKVFGDIYPEPYLGCGPAANSTTATPVPQRRIVDAPQG